MRLLGWLALGLLAACARQAPTDDGVTVVWQRVDDVQKTCQKVAGRKEVFAIHGCTKWTDSDRSGQRVCTVYAPAPRSEMDSQAFATLGHEVMHCFDGNWHDRWGRMYQEGEAAAGGTRR